jgi:hypothetical protein
MQHVLVRPFDSSEGFLLFALLLLQQFLHNSIDTFKIFGNQQKIND